ncbi:hypothetical protein ACFE04_028146 [Oxalis oulophora]
MAGIGNATKPNANSCPAPPRTYQIVVAATRDMGIGKDGKVPWKLPSDLKFFKEITTTTKDPDKQNAVIMGRKTWESIPTKYQPLPGRLNVVLTRSVGTGIISTKNVTVCESIPSALELLATHPYCLSIENVFVIGGGQLFKETLNAPGCEAIHVTEIETIIECDTFMPQIDMSQFRLSSSSSPENYYMAYVHDIDAIQIAHIILLFVDHDIEAIHQIAQITLLKVCLCSKRFSFSAKSRLLQQVFFIPELQLLCIVSSICCQHDIDAIQIAQIILLFVNHDIDAIQIVQIILLKVCLCSKRFSFSAKSRLLQKALSNYSAIRRPRYRSYSNRSNYSAKSMLVQQALFIFC